MISRVCESFGCLDWEAEEMLDRDPERVFTILRMRAYAEMKQAIDRADTKEKMAAIPETPMKELVTDVMFEIFQEDNAPE